MSIHDLSDIATIIAGLVAAVGAPIALLTFKADREQKVNEQIFYLHDYLTRKEFHDSRLLIREHMPPKPIEAWTDAEKQAANFVCSSYDQAGILIVNRIIGPFPARVFLESSWGESICHQYEKLAPYLDSPRTPGGLTGREYFWTFGKLYVQARDVQKNRKAQAPR
jgi:hypothetical protein